MSKPQAACSAPHTAASGGESHLRLLHAALSVSDSARREAERDNAVLREELAGLQEQLALVLARAAAARTEVVVADENCSVNAPPADALRRHSPPFFSSAAAGKCSTAAPEARGALVAAPRRDEASRLPDADDASAAREELLRRAAALGLAGSALFPKAMHRV